MEVAEFFNEWVKLNAQTRYDAGTAFVDEDGMVEGNGYDVSSPEWPVFNEEILRLKECEG
jgi:hypothetical protein